MISTLVVLLSAKTQAGKGNTMSKMGKMFNKGRLARKVINTAVSAGTLYLSLEAIKAARDALSPGDEEAEWLEKLITDMTKEEESVEWYKLDGVVISMVGGVFTLCLILASMTSACCWARAKRDQADSNQEIPLEEVVVNEEEPVVPEE